MPAGLENRAEIEALRTGDMKKLQFHPAPKAVPAIAFDSESGEEAQLSDYNGKLVVVNFWATWCAPCRKEMPMLDALQDELGGDNFEVVTIATGRNAPQAMKAFFDEVGVKHLPLHRDANSALARGMGVLGLPVTLILSPEGGELARLTGDADWSSDSAKAILTAMIPDS
ncbi:TlpA family protein disulfide reductase [Lutimaribacter sp. EGI FJ00015]|uniref:TlpA family protein disulfide reductase n=2 Tax=Lutimaribacter degradans TaxID=2945989 RepID=A0ACC5ZY70_9RHOB|nr:TlpA disulfide reductase family protein [Lutimaribacter sp. EGI FJ00013]MCM2563011.1 TlpA family protein disulfide reductase [Lutimaribacter sp. EGI FJ00013]MCO0614179.1 TlpA family protein disulfide reductase [Lutimaribacter sp. EGI FJ00015]MCO0636156.1 TlpA family protein disulfide reductase [Lutimaribacter sp. EGI FJ00014]